MRRDCTVCWRTSLLEEGNGNPSGKQFAMLSRLAVPFNLQQQKPLGNTFLSSCEFDLQRQKNLDVHAQHAGSFVLETTLTL